MVGLDYRTLRKQRGSFLPAPSCRAVLPLGYAPGSHLGQPLTSLGSKLDSSLPHWAFLLMSLGRRCCAALGTAGALELVLSAVCFPWHPQNPVFRASCCLLKNLLSFPGRWPKGGSESYGPGQVSPFQSVPVLELSPGKLLSEILSTAHSICKMGAVHLSLTGLLQGCAESGPERSHVGQICYDTGLSV